MGTLMSFVFMAIAIRELHAAGINTFEMLAMRSIIGLTIVLLVAWKFGWHLILLEERTTAEGKVEKAGRDEGGESKKES